MTTPRRLSLVKWVSDKLAPPEPPPRPLTPETEIRSDAVEALRSENAAVLIQQYVRGRHVRMEQQRLRIAQGLSQDPALQVQLAAQALLEKRKMALEAGLLSVEASVVGEGARWHHERSAAALRSALAQGTLSFRPPGSIGGSISGERLSLLSRPLQVVASAMAGMVERAESKEAYYPDEAGQSGDGGEPGEHALVEHCGWLLKQGRAMQNWKMRWVIVQAGCVWYWKDDSRRELLGSVRLSGTALEYRHGSRHLAIRTKERTLHLVAADESEAHAWARVLRRCIAELTDAIEERAMSLQTAQRHDIMPHSVASVAELIDLMLPTAASHALGGATAALLAQGSGRFVPTRTASHELCLCILLVTIRTFGVPIGKIVGLLAERYESGSELRRRQVAYVMLRWAQVHPAHFGSDDAGPLKSLWQSCALDGYLSELGLRIPKVSTTRQEQEQEQQEEKQEQQQQQEEEEEEEEQQQQQQQQQQQ